MSDDQIFERVAEILRENGRTMRSLEESIEKLLPLAIKANNGSGSSNKATIHQTDRTPMWVCVVIVVALATALLMRESNKNEQALLTQASITRTQADIADVRNDLRELRSVDQELRATDNAVRAYINTGILKPKAEASKAGTGK